MTEEEREQFKAKYWLTRAKNLKAERDKLIEEVNLLRKALEPFAGLGYNYTDEALQKHRASPLLFSVSSEKVFVARNAFSITSYRK